MLILCQEFFKLLDIELPVIIHRVAIILSLVQGLVQGVTIVDELNNLGFLSFRNEPTVQHLLNDPPSDNPICEGKELVVHLLLKACQLPIQTSRRLVLRLDLLFLFVPIIGKYPQIGTSLRISPFNIVLKIDRPLSFCIRRGFQRETPFRDFGFLPTHRCPVLSITHYAKVG